MRTFKKIILLFLLVAIGGSATAQFTFGPKAAINFTGFSSKTNIQPGFDAGLFFRCGHNFYFQPEVYYSFTSSTLQGAIDELKENYQIINHYIAIPLDLGYKIVNKDQFKLRLFLGPRFSFLIDSNTKQEIKNLFGTMQYGGEAGIGIDFWRFTLDFKYGFAVSKSANNDLTILWKEHIFNLALGFKILK